MPRHRWRKDGDTRIDKNGYEVTYVEGRGQVHTHRLVAEEGLGRRLIRGERVFHLDGNKLNNDPDNLEVRMTKSLQREIRIGELLLEQAELERQIEILKSMPDQIAEILMNGETATSESLTSLTSNPKRPSLSNPSTTEEGLNRVSNEREKRCARCLEQKPWSQFDMNPNGRPRSYCKPCRRLYQLERKERAKPPDKRRIREVRDELTRTDRSPEAEEEE